MKNPAVTSEPAVHAVLRRSQKDVHIVGLCTIEFITTLKDCSRPVNYLRPSNKLQVYFSFFSSQLNKNKVSGVQMEPISAGINTLITENNSLKDQHHLPGVRGSWAELLPCWHILRLHLAMAEKNWSSTVRDLKWRSKNTMDTKVVDNLVHHLLPSHSYKRSLE